MSIKILEAEESQITDAHLDYMAKLNSIQNALQKVEVHLSPEQAAMVLSVLSKDMTMPFRLRRKRANETANTQGTKSCDKCKRVDKRECDIFNQLTNNS